MVEMNAEEKKPSSVDISCLDSSNRSVASEITFQSASIDWLLQMVNQSKTGHLGGTATRRFTDPHTSQPSNDHIDTIIELKLQVAQQKETIDCLRSDLKNHALSEKRALHPKDNQPAKPMFTLASLFEEKAHSDNSRSLYHQYNELRDEMIRLQKSLYLQQEKMAAVEEENRSLTKERNRLQSQIDRMSCKMADSASLPSSSDPYASASQDFTANLTEFSGLSECELMQAICADDLHSGCQPRRASAKDQSQQQLERNSYFPNYFPKRKHGSSVSAYSHGQQGKTTPRDVDCFAHPEVKEDKNGWFIGDESERSMLSKIIFGDKGTKVVKEDDEMQVTHRRSSMPDKSTPKIKSSPHPRRRSFFHASKRSDAVVHESYRSYIQSEQIASGGDFKCIVWGDSDSDSSSEMY